MRVRTQIRTRVRTLIRGRKTPRLPIGAGEDDARGCDDEGIQRG